MNLGYFEIHFSSWKPSLKTVYTSNTVYTILLTFADGLGFWVDPPPKASENFWYKYEEDDAFNVLVVGWWKENCFPHWIK